MPLAALLCALQPMCQTELCFAADLWREGMGCGAVLKLLFYTP